MKKFLVLDVLVDIYMISSVLAIFSISNQSFSEMLFALGAKSWFICLALGSGAVFNQYTGILAFLWVVSFPVLLIAFYIMSMSQKKRYAPFCIITSVDTIIVLSWLCYCLITGNTYALNSAILDATVSLLYSAILIISLRLLGQVGGQGDGSAVSSQGNEIDPN